MEQGKVVSLSTIKSSVSGLEGKKQKRMSNIPPLNGASELWFCLEQVAERNSCEYLKRIVLKDENRKLAADRVKRLQELKEAMKGKSQIRFDDFDDYLIVHNLIDKYYKAIALHFMGRKVMPMKLWEAVQEAVKEVVSTFYGFTPPSPDKQVLVDMWVLQQSIKSLGTDD